jgi:hypothetical protein
VRFRPPHAGDMTPDDQGPDLTRETVEGEGVHAAVPEGG